ncbi:carboxypeptidase-like regulatory domain-containing protein [Bremerella sp. JC770]|uniref:carboxypeptidase-like regulatory domain-containing protein n=1 Tax=Bremerella sp. JC770 TaxID=3232137 RepID=UPI00345B46C0
MPTRSPYKLSQNGHWHLVVLVCLSTLGCSYGSGDGIGSVTGTVTLDGEPLPQVMVTFSPSNGERESYGVTSVSGQYQLRYTSRELGARTGEHQVRISPMGVEPREPVARAKDDSVLPSHYYGKDFLIRKVTPGNNQINLELTSTPSTKAG